MKRIEKFGLEVSKGIRLTEPFGFLEFLQLEANATLVLTDSGGVQEESCILRVPCVTLRDNTERPETLDVGSNILTGTNKERILDGVKLMLNKQTLGKFDQQTFKKSLTKNAAHASLNWKNPFGDGKTGSIIIKILKEAVA